MSGTNCHSFGTLHQKRLNSPGVRNDILNGIGSHLPQLCFQESHPKDHQHIFFIASSNQACTCVSRFHNKLVLIDVDVPPCCVDPWRRESINCQSCILSDHKLLMISPACPVSVH